MSTELGAPQTIEVPFDGEVTVSSVIIDQLSSGLYESPAACLKELINNSYDADATQVFLTVRPDAALIVLDDNGTGMSRSEFQQHFDRIARSHKREDTDTTKSGRPKIGKIGIGFVAANEICQRLEILSTKAGSTELMRVVLDFEQMRLDADQRRNTDESVTKGDYYGSVSNSATRSEHYTRIFLSEVKPETMDILNGARVGKSDKNLYGASTEEVAEALRKDSLRSWSDFDLYTKTVLEIALNVPVAYHDDWVEDHAEQVADLTSHAKSLKFEVVVDGTELRKPTVLASGDGKSLLTRFDLKGEHVSASGYFYARDKKLTPIDLNGMLLRIRNAAVGDYDKSYLDFPGYKSPLFQDWVSCEIYADDRLEDALNIDRRTLRVTHPAYVELQALFHVELEKFFADVRKELYGKRSVERKRQAAQAQVKEINELTKELFGARTGLPNTPKWSELKAELGEASLSKPTVDSLTKSYKPTDIIRLVRYAGQEAGINNAQITKLIEILTESFLR